MELQGTVKKIGETQTFASGFQKRELVLETDEEIWIPIIDFDNRYLISNKGRILSIERTINNNGGLMTKKEKILNPHIDKGYYKISLKNNSGIRKTFLLHLGTFKNKDEAINCRLNYELNNNIKNKYNELNKL